MDVISEARLNQRYGIVSCVKTAIRNVACNLAKLASNLHCVLMGAYLWYAYRKEFEGEYFTYFSWEEPETIGIVGVAEVNNQFIGISMPKKQNENNNESDKDE